MHDLAFSGFIEFTFNPFFLFCFARNLLLQNSLSKVCVLQPSQTFPTSRIPSQPPLSQPNSASNHGFSSPVPKKVTRPPFTKSFMAHIWTTFDLRPSLQAFGIHWQRTVHPPRGLDEHRV
jgi:hypothetical protein